MNKAPTGEHRAPSEIPAKASSVPEVQSKPRTHVEFSITNGSKVYLPLSYTYLESHREHVWANILGNADSYQLDHTYEEAKALIEGN